MDTLMDIEEVYSQFQYARFTAIYEVGEFGLNLPPYKGSTFRGAFGHMFKEKFCCCNKKSELHEPDCIYKYIFETSPSEDATYLEKFENVPRPFLIEPPTDERKTYFPGEKIYFDFVLFGKAVHYYSYFIYTFMEMGFRGLGKGKNYAELDVVLFHNQESSSLVTVYSRKLKKVDSIGKTSLKVKRDEQIIDRNKISVYFITPTRIKLQGSYINEPDFHVLIRNIIRRTSSILYFHHDLKLEIDEYNLVDKASKIIKTKQYIQWKDWERYSNRQNERIKLGGFVGYANFQGELEPFLPWFYLGEILHIGKNVVFGLGKIKLV